VAWFDFSVPKLVNVPTKTAALDNQEPSSPRPRQLSVTERRYCAPAFPGAQKMALHYFHLSNDTVILDAIGVELSDLKSVRLEAVRALRELLSLRENDGLWAGDPWKVWVTDEPSDGGQTILTLQLTAG
jgi:hypothetical protein